jgi:SSS family solute:Na+ symporter
MVLMLAIGWYFYKKNQTEDDYYVGGRNMGAWHIGLSVVATDVGGGFSIGLGGLGFTMGISGSWMLFTGLIGAWLAACLLIPKVFALSKQTTLFTFPQIFLTLFGKKAGFIAAIISLIGYLGFTSSQLLAGAKLASGTFPALHMNQALLIMGIIAVVYTVLGGLKAVIYTDTVQWIILLTGLIFIGLPMAYSAIGGYEAIKEVLSPEMLSLKNISAVQLINWSFTIIPIWFIGMTLYQRIYACRDEKTAKKAWYIAGLFEWPVMAFLGVSLGLMAKVAAEQGMFLHLGFGPDLMPDPEIGLPMLLSNILPAGLLGLMMAAYFSAILSTADSCLMAASGNLVTDLLPSSLNSDTKKMLRLSQIATLVLGAVALGIALYLESVLELMLLSYAFMVSGLLVPLLAGLFFKQRSQFASIASMIIGGGLTLGLTIFEIKLPLGFDPIIAGLAASCLSFAACRNFNLNT